ncbi:insecticidal delta-endotoxin, partial [Bacillus thuringiensis]|nr:insecticidal delta-endotoxin [Bacillus thuringiensis]MED2715972.1 insecticidal delta-endotoxin [Bacillus thuringiensis]
MHWLNIIKSKAWMMGEKLENFNGSFRGSAQGIEQSIRSPHLMDILNSITIYTDAHRGYYYWS